MAEQKKRGRWSEDSMKHAIEYIMNEKMGIREAASHFQVPKSTLSDKIKILKGGLTVDMHPQLGRFKRTFSIELESHLIDHLKDLDNKMMPMNKDEFLRFAYELAEHLKIPHQFNNEKRKAGKKFYYEFMSRHSEISLRTAQSTSMQRAIGFNKHQVELFFDKYEQLLTKLTPSPMKIFNCDETGVSVVHENAVKVLSQKGKKQVSKITSGERGKNVTVLLAINATGDLFIPPLFVFGRKKMAEELKKDAPEGSIFACEESGWITANSFLTWLKMFVRRVNPTKESPALLILDGHSSHKELNVILYAREHHVHMISLPPHTTHKLQPLDRTIMRPFKAAYNEACTKWMNRYHPLKIAQRDIVGLVKTAFTSICRMELAISGFSCTGLYPLNKNIFSDLDYIAAAHFSQSSYYTGLRGDSQQGNTVSGPSSTYPVNSATPEHVFELMKDDGAPSCSKLVSTSLMCEKMFFSSGVDTTELLKSQEIPIPSSSAGFMSSTFQLVADKLSPITDETRKKISQRKRRSETSEILTSSPYKTLLEEKRQKHLGLSAANKKHTKKKSKVSGPDASKQNTSNQCTVKEAKKRINPVNRQLDFSQSQEDLTECIICMETTQEDWVQCTSCKGWAHVACTEQENILFYKCDHCS